MVTQQLARTASRPAAHEAQTLAAIDMGSNSFRLEIARLVGQRYRRVLYLKDTVRLGSGLDAQGMLTEEAIARGLDSLRRFSSALGGLPLGQTRAVATQTLREARNRNAFLEQAQAALGYPIEVISGREEARLIYAGVAHMQPSSQPRLVVDIGGRSTELILGTGRRPSHAESFAVGSVSMTMRFFADGRLTPQAFRQAQIAAGAELEEGLSQFTPDQWREALGASGTAGAVSDVLEASGITDGRMSIAGLQWLIERCLEAGSVERLTLPALKDDRKPVLAGGLCILYTLLTQFGIDALEPAKGALRQGVIVDLHHRLSGDAGDLRDTSVRALQRRFAVDIEQARRVRDLALDLYTAGLPAERIAHGADVDELRWAGELHELGMAVSHHDHHRHSAYLLGHVDAPGFSQSQQRRLATWVLGQRGALRKVEDILRDVDRAWLLLCLRLAVILCHARVDPQLKGFNAERRGHQVKLAMSANWQARHPRSAFLLREEVAAWADAAELKVRLAA